MGRGFARSIRCALLISSLPLTSCQGGYPIAPTACDDWCTVTKNSFCQDYNPAECVASCEASGITSAPCREQFDAALACWRTTTLNDCFGSMTPCVDAEQALTQCGAATRLQTGTPSQE